MKEEDGEEKGDRGAELIHKVLQEGRIPLSVWVYLLNSKVRLVTKKIRKEEKILLK